MLALIRKALSHIEIVAYLVAIWSFAVLFAEPVIGYYLDYRAVEIYTALANLILLLLAILNRALFGHAWGTQRILIFDVVMLIMGSLLMLSQAKFVIFFLLIRQTYFILQFILFKAFDGKLFKWMSGNPPVTLMLSFALVILIGTVLLMFPVSSRLNRVTPPVDALFTATSATCVTGLVVLDTGTHFSLFGQIVILMLIQIGGLGIMTISTVFALLLGQRINLKLENVMHQVVGGSYAINLYQLLKNIILVTVVIELLGALGLYFKFSQDFAPLKAAWMSVFHSVSAFCNAGFSPLSGNLAGYVDSLTVNVWITGLIILGGLGFTVIIDLLHYFFVKGKARKLNLHSKVVLLTTATLVLFGFIVFYLAEYQGSMAGFGVYRRVLSSWFQSVTTRTAGFNTIDMARLSKASVLTSILLMFIGASPGSTGGGVKTTTFAMLVISVVSLLKGRRFQSIFKRRIPDSNFREATGLTSISLAIVFAALLLLLLAESHSFDQLAFEAMSAFGTVGLSMGITPTLSVAGKLLITLLMYIGRIGPLTLIYAFAIHRKQVDIDYAEENIVIG